MAGLIRVKVIEPFYDFEEKVSRAVGDMMDVTEERLSELNACGPMQWGSPLVKEVRRKGRAKQQEEQIAESEER